MATAKNVHFPAAPASCVKKGMSKNDGDSDDDIGSVKFSFFLYTFSQIEERPILEDPLATHGVSPNRFLGIPPIFQTNLTLDHITRNYLHITD